MKMTGKLGDTAQITTVDSAVILELTIEEAKVLLALTGRITGNPQTTYRSVTNNIWFGLNKVLEEIGIPYSSGSWCFSPGNIDARPISKS